MLRFFLALSISAVFLVAACATSPTGRKQLILFPDSEMNKMGLQSFTELKRKTPIEYDSRTNTYVKCITDAITRAAKSQTQLSNWEVVVFRDSSANAFALPGGKIGVYTGILKVATTADQLAAVLGHEVGHVIARHGTERVSQAAAQEGILSIVDAMGDKGSTQHGLLMAGLGLGAQFGIMLPFSRKHESEADEIGLYLMAQAGFNPQESIQLWRNMSQTGGGSPPEILSTHPSNASRISGLQSKMAKAMTYYNQTPATDCGSY